MPSADHQEWACPAKEAGHDGQVPVQQGLLQGGHQVRHLSPQHQRVEQGRAYMCHRLSIHSTVIICGATKQNQPLGLHGAIMVHIAHFRSKLHTPKRLGLLGGSTFVEDIHN